jgi:hypothetical protein
MEYGFSAEHLKKKMTVNTPQFLYKYHSLSLNLMEMMTSAEFYMSPKSELNDPLDSAVIIDVEDYLNLYLERYPSFRNDEAHIKRVKHVFSTQLEKFDNEWVTELDEFHSSLKVTCFTEDGNNSLMWSHYANNHNGVCLKFDLSKDSNLQNNVLPVEYKDELVKVKQLADFSKSLLTKLKTWEVEKEWRILSEKKKFSFKQEALVEIVFGLRVPDSTINWFKYFRENVYYMHAPIYRLKLVGNKFVKVDEYDELASD